MLGQHRDSSPTRTVPTPLTSVAPDDDQLRRLVRLDRYDHGPHGLRNTRDQLVDDKHHITPRRERQRTCYNHVSEVRAQCVDPIQLNGIPSFILRWQIIGITEEPRQVRIRQDQATVTRNIEPTRSPRLQFTAPGSKSYIHHSATSVLHNTDRWHIILISRNDHGDIIYVPQCDHVTGHVDVHSFLSTQLTSEEIITDSTSATKLHSLLTPRNRILHFQPASETPLHRRSSLLKLIDQLINFISSTLGTHSSFHSIFETRMSHQNLLRMLPITSETPDIPRSTIQLLNDVPVGPNTKSISRHTMNDVVE